MKAIFLFYISLWKTPMRVLIAEIALVIAAISFHHPGNWLCSLLEGFFLVVFAQELISRFMNKDE